ncbi:MAG: patatin-like phospholipase family protein [Woeseiaceae bacterium]|nr:patatin-like phospholipase family protein [Woeseiaceae bacterium]
MSQVNRSRRSLIFSAGPAALREVREHGFDPARIGTLAGASGGAKWLVLSQLDRVVAGELLPRMQGPVHTIGTSIGAWRFACYGQADPVAAIDRFEQAYLEQSYSDKPDRAEISAKTREILEYVLGDTGVEQILANSLLRTHILAVRSRGLSASERSVPLMLGLVSAAGLNAVNRRTLGLSFDRVLFHDPRDRPPFYELNGFPMHRVELSRDNYRDAVLATGAIPLVLEGVRDIAGAPPGMYRDGGVIDYHLDFEHSADDRLALYLHFYDHLTPGWFDKRLSRRSASVASANRTILVSPSPGFVARLPNGKIPDRHDFAKLTPAERVRVWRGVVDACRELADELREVLEQERLPARLLPYRAA